MQRKNAPALLCAFLFSLSAVAAWADGAVYAMTNALDNNQILVYHRGADGNLTAAPVQTVNSGGGGSGLQLAGVDALGSAGSIQLDPSHHLLFVVNTESAAENNGAGAYNTDCRQGTITSFVVAADGTLTFADRVFSRGLFPNSLAVRSLDSGKKPKKGTLTGDLLYVLNAGGPETPTICNGQPATSNGPNVTGFIADDSGRLVPVRSTQSIDPGPATGSGETCSAASAAGFSGLTGAPAADFQCGLNPPSFPRSPAQVGFTPGGDQLVVTVKGTNTIYAFQVGLDGTLSTPVTVQAPGPAIPTYFGFTFDRGGNLLLAEMFGAATSIPAGGQGAISSFSISSTGHLTSISTHVGDGGTAPCCIAIEPIAGNYVYLANNLSASIASYTVAGGTMSLVNGTAGTGAGPNDLATAQENGTSFLYVVDAGTGTVGAFRINLGDGSLTAITGGMGLPANRSAQGLAAY
jgi:6-phosphogluconolactonase